MIVGLFMVFGYYLASTFKVLTLFGLAFHARFSARIIFYLSEELE